VSYLKVYEQERVIDKLTTDVVDMNTHEFNSNL